MLIEDGTIQWRQMRRGSITPDDLTEALRLETNQTDPSKVRFAYLERNGRISVVPCKPEPRVFVGSVEEGVQTARIELE